MKAYDRHIIVCKGKDCKKAGGGKPLIKTVRKLLGKDARHTKCSKVSCLGVCKQAPLMLIYPDGIWYTVPDAEALEQIAESHLRGGKPVNKHTLHQMPTTHT